MSPKIVILVVLALGLGMLPFITRPFSNPPPVKEEKAASPQPPKFPQLTVDSIFSSSQTIPQEAEPSDIRTIIVTGDVIPARAGNYVVLQKNDFTYPWLATKDMISQADLRIINLEAALSPECPILHSGFTLCGDPRHIEGLKFAKIDLVGLENNHITNLGSAGLLQTEKALDAAGIGWARRDKLAVKEVNGLKVGLLAFNGIGERVDRANLVKQIDLARPMVDILLVIFHWGKEYERLPKTDGSIAPDNPQELAHLSIDQGVDLVLGNHPHWFQAVEIYRGRLITYAHGNFIFDQMWSEETRVGVIGEYTFYKNELVKVSFIPIKIFDYVQPKPLTGQDSAAVISEMKRASLELTNLSTK